MTVIAKKKNVCDLIMLLSERQFGGRMGLFKPTIFFVICKKLLESCSVAKPSDSFFNNRYD